MSVSLDVKLTDGQSDSFFLGSYHAIKDHWGGLASTLGLSQVPCFYSFFEIRRDNISSVIEEVSLLRQAAQQKGGDFWDNAIKHMDQLLLQLRKLENSDGWTALIG